MNVMITLRNVLSQDGCGLASVSILRDSKSKSGGKADRKSFLTHLLNMPYSQKTVNQDQHWVCFKWDLHRQHRSIMVSTEMSRPVHTFNCLPSHPRHLGDDRLIKRLLTFCGERCKHTTTAEARNYVLRVQTWSSAEFCFFHKNFSHHDHK